MIHTVDTKELTKIASCHKQSGFSLMELLVYMTIVGILVAGLVGGFAGFIAKGKRSSTNTALQTLKTAIFTYHSEYGKYPTKLQDLVEKPKADLGKKWYSILEKLPKDGWNEEFNYRVTQGGKQPYELYSSGGSEEDPEAQISVWDL